MKKFLKCLRKVEELSGMANGKILIFGSGHIGQCVLADFNSLGITVSAFIDNSKSRIGQSIEGVIVKSVDYINEIDKNCMFICCAVTSEDMYFGMRHQLESFGLTECIHFGDFGLNLDGLYYQDDFDLLSFRKDEGHDLRQKLLKRGLPRFKQGNFMPDYSAKSIVFDIINLTVNTFCSLKCKDCAFAIPYVPKPQNFDAEQIVSDLDKLLSVSITPLVSLVGGEVFVYPNMSDLVSKLKQMKNYKNVGRFEIITNGTILPSQDLLLSLKELTCFDIAINDYETDNSKIESIIELCKKCGVPYRLGREAKKIWGDHGNYETFRNRSDAEKKHLYYLCGTCCALYNGKLYTCNRAAILQENNLVKYDATDSIDIRGYNDLPEVLEADLFRFLYEKPYISTCDYCDGYIALPDGTPAFKQIPMALQLNSTSNHNLPLNMEE